MALRPFIIEPPFTGDRTYLHGADIFDGIVRHLGAGATDVRLTLTAASDCAIEVREDDAGLAASPAGCGSVSYRDDGVRRRLRLQRRQDLPIRERLALDEDSLIEGARFAGDGVSIPAGEAPLMRRVAAASLYRLRSSYPEEYWAIAEISCARLPPRQASASVTFRALLGGLYWQATARTEQGDGGGTILLARGGPRR